MYFAMASGGGPYHVLCYGIRWGACILLWHEVGACILLWHEVGVMYFAMA